MTIEIVERLKKIADAAKYPEGSPYSGDSPFGEQIREAALTIESLVKALEELLQVVDEPAGMTEEILMNTYLTREFFDKCDANTKAAAKLARAEITKLRGEAS